MTILWVRLFIEEEICGVCLVLKVRKILKCGSESSYIRSLKIYYLKIRCFS